VRAAVFTTPDANHFRRASTVVAALAGAGVEVRVYTDRRFGPEVEAAGATLADVFTPFPLDSADAVSIPRSCRDVAWAGVFGDAIIREAAAFAPDVVLYDSFAVIGRVVGTALGIPYVSIVAGHNMDPARVIPEIERDPRVKLAPECLAAVEVLRSRHGWADASPFSYYSALSPHLNLYCEPPAFLTEAERPPFAPLAFWGSVRAVDEGAVRPPRERARPPRRVYASMGTIVWRYWAAEAHAALRAVAGVVERSSGMQAVLSVGGYPLDDAAMAELERPNVRVMRWADQWEELREADAFFTHCGLNSSHEACFHRVPMIAYPFFGDQPGLAARCGELGLAVALAESRAPVTEEHVAAALERLNDQAPAIDAALELAHARELEVIAGRPAVVDQILALA